MQKNAQAPLSMKIETGLHIHEEDEEVETAHHHHIHQHHLMEDDSGHHELTPSQVFEVIVFNPLHLEHKPLYSLLT